MNQRVKENILRGYWGVRGNEKREKRTEQWKERLKESCKMRGIFGRKGEEKERDERREKRKGEEQ